MLFCSLLFIIALPVTLFSYMVFWIPSFDSWSSFELRSYCWETLTFSNSEYSSSTNRWVRAEYPRQCARDIVQFALLVAPVMVTAVMLLLAIGFSMFGRELFRHWWMKEINSSPVPDSNGNITIKTVQSTLGAGGLRHKLYDLDECPWEISDWLARELSATPSDKPLSSIQPSEPRSVSASAS